MQMEQALQDREELHFPFTCLSSTCRNLASMRGSDVHGGRWRVSECQHEGCDGNVLGLFQLQSTETSSNQLRQKNECGRRTLGK